MRVFSICTETGSILFATRLNVDGIKEIRSDMSNAEDRLYNFFNDLRYADKDFFEAEDRTGKRYFLRASKVYVVTMSEQTHDT